MNILKGYKLCLLLCYHSCMAVTFGCLQEFPRQPRLNLSSFNIKK